MLLPLLKDLLLVPAAFAAGAINSVAGGGTLLTFPTLLSLGVAPTVANATSTVALVPGSMSAFWGYRSEMGEDRRILLWIGLPSLIGGFVGARVLLLVSEDFFALLIPWLILGATALFIVQEPINRWLRSRRTEGVQTDATEKPSRAGLIGAIVFQFFVAVYGGFFGAGIGILMLAALGMLGLSNIHRMNGLKNFANICINSVAALTFIIGRRVDWRFALLMMAAAIVGGYGGAGAARRIGQKNVRRLVVAIGLAIAVLMFVRQLNHVPL